MQGNSFGKVQTLYTTEAAYQAPKTSGHTGEFQPRSLYPLGHG